MSQPTADVKLLSSPPTHVQKQEEALGELFGGNNNALRCGPLADMTAEDKENFRFALITLSFSFCSKKTIREFLQFTKGDEGIRIY